MPSHSVESLALLGRAVLLMLHLQGRITIVDADKPKPVSSEEKGSVLRNIIKLLLRQLPHNRHVYSAEERTDFAHIATLSSGRAKYPTGAVISKWINEHMSQGLLINNTLLGGGEDGIPASEWEDPRVRPLSIEDTLRNDLYMEIDIYRRAVQALIQVRHASWSYDVISLVYRPAGPAIRP